MVQTWKSEDQGIEECPECGRKYKVTMHRFPMKDCDHFDCKCGHRLDSWNSTHCPTYSLVGSGEGA